MKIVIIHGQSHQGSTCHIARQLAEKLKGDKERNSVMNCLYL